MAHPKSPKPWDVRTARHKTGLTMEEAGELVYVGRSTWFSWERNPDYSDYLPMHPAFAELFALKVGLKELHIIPTKVTEDE
jgi:DNA-binding XRE family transcriptional regulator